jgi:hypothetical protein
MRVEIGEAPERGHVRDVPDTVKIVNGATDGT